MLCQLSLLLLFLAADNSWSCGSLTHMEIAFRALEYFNATYKGLDIHQLVLKYPESLQAGAVFPDSYYNGACYFGVFHDVSETTHWMKFIKASLDYFNEQYKSKPIDETGERLLVFIFGVVSHDVSDVLWHSLGIDQGFIDTMAQLNFHGDYQSAHTIADPGGDAVNLYQMNFAGSFDKAAKLRWYVPVQDMVNIYMKMGISFNKTIVNTCAIYLMQVEAGGELEIFEGLYSAFLSTGSFLGTQYTDYFLGGVQVMASWTMQRWMTALLYLESNGENCTSSDDGTNPFYWVCGDQSRIEPPPKTWLPAWQQQKGSPYIDFYLYKRRQFLSKKSASLPRRNHIQISGLKSSLYSDYEKISSNSSTYFLKKPYASIGRALLSADINQDGFDDLVIGVPGYSLENRFQEGLVCVVLGDRSGLPLNELDLEHANITFLPPFAGVGRFGYAVVALDYNGDTLLDLVISAPLFSPDTANKLYSGQVYIFYGRANGKFITASPDVIIDCKLRFCNLGTHLSVADVNRDGKQDLIIGSPFASQSLGDARQNGFVAVYFGGSGGGCQRRASAVVVDVIVNGVGRADVFLWGRKPYSWFGSSAISTSECSLLIGAPAEKLLMKNGTQIQMLGAVYCYDLASKNISIFAQGSREFANFGSSITIGYPNGKKSSPIVAVSAPNDDNIGTHFKILPLDLKQAGSVYLFSSGGNLIAKMAGDRRYSGFGKFIKFEDVDNDGFDDLCVGAPMRQPHLVNESYGEAVGEMFLYSGSENFPQNFLHKSCKGAVDPCPEDIADRVFVINDNRAQFGSNLAVVRNGDQTQIAIAAQYSSQYSRQSGKIAILNDFSRSPTISLIVA